MSADRLAELGWGPRVEALVQPLLAAAAPGESLEAGRVVRVDYDRCAVATRDGVVTARAADLPAVGDWVVVAPPSAEGGDHRVEARVERWSALERVLGDGSVQVMAADVDLVLVTTGLDREPTWARLDRELVLAWASGARPVVVLNKADLLEPAAVADLVERAVARLGGVEVVATSVRDGQGIERLAELARPDRTVVLLGASGVGKSSLVNALVGSAGLATGAVRDGDHRGRHTTTARHLVPLPGGGVLLDTPGVRSLALGEVGDGLASAFADIERLAEGCRFRDCAHEHEPGCAVRAALDAGEIDPQRHASWNKLRTEVAWMASIADRGAGTRRPSGRPAPGSYRRLPKR